MKTTRPAQDDLRAGNKPSASQSQGNAQARPQAILWNTPELAAYLNVKEGTIRYWVHVKYIPHIKFQSLVRFRKTDIDTWLDTRTAPGRLTTAKKVSEEILEDIQARPRRGRLPRAKL
ncbi:MAG: helix-turn-helix domain-containing protein [Nitrospirae bacterium]|nr:helix-turn-helix domain-containing protein [Nitrospirota bacterium]